jgi:hypothetical protein
MVSHVLLGFAALVVYIGWALLRPIRRCPRCHGTRIQGGRHPRPCKRCKGQGRTKRLAATMIHRFFWSVVDEINRDPARDQPKRHVERTPE